MIGFTTTAFAQTVAEFKFDQETHDFGKISQGKPATVELKFTNSGTDDLNIFSVDANCACTKTDFPRTPVKKGASGTITITYDAAAIGVFLKGVTVKSNAKTSVKILYVKGEVVAVKGGSLKKPLKITFG